MFYFFFFAPALLFGQGGAPYGGNLEALAIDPSNPSTIYAGTAVLGYRTARSPEAESW